MAALGLSPKRLRVWRSAAEHALFAVVPVVFTAYMWHFATSHQSFAVDFHNAFWPAGHRVLLGLTPYAGAHSSLAHEGIAFVYPAVGAALFAATALVPHGAADILFTLLSMAAVIATLLVLRIRDWRLYGLSLLCPAVISGWQTANVTLLLVFGVALAWRFRDRPLIVGCLVALLVSVKVFLWPLALWLVVTRRFVGLAWAVVFGTAMNLVAWGVLGFSQVNAYVDLARAVSRVEETMAYTPLALVLRLGASRSVAYALALALAAVAAVACVRLGRRGRDSSAFVMALAVSLLATPTVWRHYFALLLVPLAIARPRLSAAWLVPLALYVCPVTSPLMWQLILGLVVFAVVVVALVRKPSPAGDAGRDPAPLVLGRRAFWQRTRHLGSFSHAGRPVRART